MGLHLYVLVVTDAWGAADPELDTCVEVGSVESLARGRRLDSNQARKIGVHHSGVGTVGRRSDSCYVLASLGCLREGGPHQACHDGYRLPRDGMDLHHCPGRNVPVLWPDVAG